MDYKRITSPSVYSCGILIEELDLFDTLIDRDNTDPALPPLPSGDIAPVLCLHKVRLGLRNIKPRKAARPDRLQRPVLKACADELTEVLTTIYNVSLTSWVPACFKAAIMVPVSK